MDYQFTRLSSLMAKSASRFKMSGTLQSALMMHVFSSVVVELLPYEIAVKVKPKFVKSGVLWVRVPHSIAAQMVSEKADLILKSVEQKVGSIDAKKLRVVVE